MINTEYFTPEEVKEISKAMGEISGIGFSISSYKSTDPQMKAFFNKAKLWRVIKTIISNLYIKRLSDGKMFLKDTDGNEYRVTRKEENA